ncbi:putative nucleic acid-binding protein [Deinococcus metalli]|uniref:PIN domain-containing protein n=1 Tax=Deinococcus metalli TaxID=1141878 RepID=A0A7W8NSJ2_9DEIO|nr:PIN domain-containing protein [Deinococcus metalli]MBB5378033.1 putative nucleic acid-binding protein [Deinococcus metalli]GHF53904.1 PIN domain-containing protein [Deinococcus metalli]
MRPLVALLDASVLYPSLTRNLLMHLGTAGIIAARWSDAIHDEWMTNLLADRPDLTPERLQRTLGLMRQALPDATVQADEAVTTRLVLPDPGDRHVLAASLGAGADVLVTWNLRHFPAAVLEPHGLEAVTPDELVSRHLDAAAVETRAAVEALRQSLRRPPYSWTALVDRLEAVGLTATAHRLRM